MEIKGRVRVEKLAQFLEQLRGSRSRAVTLALAKCASRGCELPLILNLSCCNEAQRRGAGSLYGRLSCICTVVTAQGVNHCLVALCRAAEAVHGMINSSLHDMPAPTGMPAMKPRLSWQSWCPHTPRRVVQAWLRRLAQSRCISWPLEFCQQSCWQLRQPWSHQSAMRPAGCPSRWHQGSCCWSSSIARSVPARLALLAASRNFICVHTYGSCCYYCVNVVSYLHVTAP